MTPGYGKFNRAAKEDRTWNGQVYDSKTEMFRAQELQLGLNAGEYTEVVEQPVFELTEAKIKYIADFRITGKDGRAWVEDVKGYKTERFRLVAQLWAYYGTLPLIVLKAKGTLGKHTWEREEIIPRRITR